MTGPVSTFPIVKAGLVGLLRASSALTGVTVDYGDPGGALEREHVFLGGTGDDGQEWISVGGYHQEESYGITFLVHVGNAGMTQQEATERAHVLYGALQTVVHTAVQNLDQLAVGAFNLGVKPKAVGEYVIEQGHACVISGEIAVEARI